MTVTQSPERRPAAAPGRSWRGLKITAGIVFGLVMLLAVGAIAALTFSVQVQGQSMSPTLSQGDRLVTDFFDGGSSVKRFDVVGAEVDGYGSIVKRVVGMPGDRIRVESRDGVPVVVLRPAGATVDYTVDNPAWTGQVAGKDIPCCDANGTTAVQESTDTVVPAGRYWLVGDNWGGSDDSRTFGFVTADQLAATLNFRLLPAASFGRLPDDVRLVEAGTP